jgi:type I restriction enzyme S subunit
VTATAKKDGWREVTLGELFEISSSKRVLQEQWQSSGVPFYRAREIVKLAKNGVVENELFISEEQFDEYRKQYGVPAPGDLMVSAVGTLGACYVVQPKDRFYYKDASVLRFSPKVPVHSKFVQYAFGTNQILDQINKGSGSTVGTFTIERANKTRMFLPPLAEQRRIAEILDKTETLRTKRRAALAQLDNLIQSVFLDMFGDPISNIEGWKTCRLEDVATTITDGTHKTPVYTQSGIEFLSAKDLKDGGIDWGTRKFISEQEHEELTRRCNPELGDILLAKSGSLGNVAIIDRSHQFSLFESLCLIKHDRNLVDATFLVGLLRTPAMLAHLLGKNKGIAIKHLHLVDIRNLRITLPPIYLQQEFGRRITSAGRLRKVQQASLIELGALHTSLQHLAFRGEL